MLEQLQLQLQSQITISALIHGIERDLRDSIRNYFEGETIDTLFSEQRVFFANERRRQEGKRNEPSGLDLLEYMDFQDTVEVLQQNKSQLSNEMQEAVAYLAENASTLSPIRNRVAHNRPLEVEDPYDAEKIANKLATWPDDWVTTSHILTLLKTDPTKVVQLKIHLTADPEKGPSHNLPPADYSETGFFGRKHEIEQVQNALKGSFPVISIIGDGGMGKTSLALKVAYELLEDPDCPYQALVWATAKATILTPSEIENISDAVQDSLGLLALAGKELGSQADQDDPVDELLDYLATFPILLILDNLETVLDNNLVSFLGQLPLGSKVLLTSRVGLGELEFKVPTRPLAEYESIGLLRRLATARGVQELTQADGDKLKAYVSRMHGNPTHIKWFVSSVQAGVRPEDALSDDGLVLDFCMTNVYQFLEPDAHTVLSAMQSENSPLNLGELSSMLSFTARQLVEAVSSLTRSNFVSLVSVSHDDYRGSFYELSEQARKYLDKYQPVPPEKRQNYRQKLEGSRLMGRSIQREGNNNPYDWQSIQIEVKGELPAAKLLKDAINNASQNPSRALDLCKEAQALSPEYAEVWRVAGQIEWEQGDISEARRSFEMSVQGTSEPNHVSLYFAGRFFVESEEDCHLGLNLLQRANVKAPGTPEILAWTAKAWQLLGDSDSALDVALSVAILPSAFRESSLHFSMEMACPMLLDYSRNGQTNKTIELTARIVDILRKVPVEDIASITDYLHLTIQILQDSLADTVQATQEIQTKTGQLMDLIRRAEPDDVTRTVGTIKVPTKDGYTFVRSKTNDKFLHIRGMRDSSQWDYIQPGAYIGFRPTKSADGRERAEDAVLLNVEPR